MDRKRLKERIILLSWREREKGEREGEKRNREGERERDIERTGEREIKREREGVRDLDVSSQLLA